MVAILSVFISGCNLNPKLPGAANNAQNFGEEEPAASDQTSTTTMQNQNQDNEPAAAEEQASSTDSAETQTAKLSEAYKGAILKTNLGDITVEFYGTDSPNTVDNFLKLAQDGFYDGTKFHRVIKDFMIQGGDPNSKDDDWSNDGMGGPGYKFADEFNSHKLVRGSLAMANSGADTNGSQFFIVTAAATPWLDGKHTNFGQVVKGMEVVDKIGNLPKNENNHPTEDATIDSIELVKK